MSGREANWSAAARLRQGQIASERLRGRSVSSQTRQKIAAGQVGEKGHNWRGDAVGYMGAHKRHRAALPRECAHCGRADGRLDVALRNDVPDERLLGAVRYKRHYSVHAEDYLRLCRSCHNSYDGRVPPWRRELA